MQHGNKVIALEVKAGSAGKLKSLHLFMALKQYPVAARIYTGLPNITSVDVKNSTGDQVQYKLISIPFYLLGQIHRLLDLNI